MVCAPCQLEMEMDSVSGFGLDIRKLPNRGSSVTSLVLILRVKSHVSQLYKYNVRTQNSKPVVHLPSFS